MNIKDKIKEKWFNHPLFPKLKEKYPARDYDFQFELLWDWWENRKRKPPQTITAFENWLRNSKPDPKIIEDNQKQKEREDMIKNNANPDKPISAKGLKQLEEMRKKWGGIKNI